MQRSFIRNIYSKSNQSFFRSKFSIMRTNKYHTFISYAFLLILFKYVCVFLLYIYVGKICLYKIYSSDILFLYVYYFIIYHKIYIMLFILMWKSRFYKPHYSIIELHKICRIILLDIYLVIKSVSENVTSTKT